jgi:outer membrane receptor protein involved in Fe transport
MRKETLALAVLLLARASGADRVSGTVVDPSGSAVPAAHITVYNAQSSPVAEARATPNGQFAWEQPAAGSYQIHVEAPGFAPRDVRLVWPAESAALTIELELAPARDQVSVSATRGLVDDPRSAAHVVNVRNREDFLTRPAPTVGSALRDVAGVTLQTTTYGHVSPILRGLTGYQTLILFDGVRFNTSIFRSGPNQYMAFVDPGQAATVEAVLGPASASYGSDALGGAISILSPEPRYSAETGERVRGDFALMSASADASLTSQASVSFAGRNVWWMLAGSARRLNDLRAGGGFDSRHVFRRYFGLPQEQIRELTGSRLQDTAFAQYGGQTKFSWRMDDRRSLAALFQRSDLDGSRSYRDQWGGLGRLQALFEPQYGELGYLRYEHAGIGPLDSLTGRFSFNRISDGSIRQGLRPSDVITREAGSVSAYGYSLQGTTHVARQHVQIFGTEYYDERVDAYGFQRSPGGPERQVRALFPNGARYGAFALFGQNVTELMRGRVRLIAGGRWTGVRFKTEAASNLTASGDPLGVTDSIQHFSDLTYHTGLTFRLVSGLSVHALTGRGFRAPNVADLGGIGLSGLGYEVPAADAVAHGALLGISAADDALPAGRKVAKLDAETLRNYEFGVSFQSRRLYARAQTFLADFGSPVVRRTLLFETGSVPASLAGVAVTALPQTPAQRQAGVAAVATPFDSRAVKAIVNDGAARYSGVDFVTRATLTSRWTLDGAYSLLAGRVLNPNRRVRRLPPQQGFLALRHVPGGRRPWFEIAANLAGAQDRLSPEDLDDERMGASRRRSDIAAFFQGGLVQPWLDQMPRGPVFRPTGETLRQIQDRVLPLGASINGVQIVNDASRVPLLIHNAGFVALDVRGGIPLSERWRMHFGVLNVTDRNYRVIGSGVDMNGRSAFVGLRAAF